MTTEMNSKSIIYLTYKFHRDGPTAAFNIQLEISYGHGHNSTVHHMMVNLPCLF